MSMFTGFRVLGSGMSAQRTRLNITSSNLANANTTRTDEGGAYRRRDPVFSAQALGNVNASDSISNAIQGVSVTDIALDESPLPVIFDPGHPDADAEGYVTMPNVNVVEEMVHMTTSARSFEANASAFQTLKQMMQRAIDMGK
jgi:flagellar basal-body rod protein FlgC